MDNTVRYRDAMHAVQSGVAAELSIDINTAAATPKHLRTGVNAAMVNTAALAALLIKKGLFTLEEYEESLANQAEIEKARYEKSLSKHYGKEIKLV